MTVDLLGFLGVVLVAYVVPGPDFLLVVRSAAGVACWFALVVVAARPRALLTRPKIRRRWELTTGWLFIAIGVSVAAVA
jgi:threonine/homoserine/homoserine lactone efflux protein